MRFKGIKVLSLLLIFLIMGSCIEEDLDEKEQLLEYRVYSNTEGALISLTDYSLTVKDYWEKKFVTKGYYGQIVARCDDPKVLITAEIYVDGKLRAKMEKNSYLNLTHRIKGNGY
ncbi:hypothetical protein MM236_17745 [Belliella sp. DSM 107340]|uniref:Uncharacterized protein n=1 Tax=Belliella calami TaxID=2923436 RepID=A0ABS9UT91_9BACT|nr:hypothetical protein [Belliella calami]MCH7399842.1 hypothetical protein [Belliella calami]